MSNRFATDDKLAAARDVAVEAYPFLARSLLAMTPVISDRPNLAMSTDQFWRLYHNPDSEWYKATPVEQMAGVLIHEVSHLQRDHHERAFAMGITRNGPEAKAANRFMDARINDDIATDNVLSLPEDAIFSAPLGLPGNRAWEEDFAEWREQEPEDKMPGNQSDGGDGDQEGDNGGGSQDNGGNQHQRPTTGDDGSGATGIPRDWEMGAPDEENPGIPKEEADLIRDQTARDIQNGLAAGNVPGNWQRWAASRLKVKPDPRKQLRTIVARNVNEVGRGNDTTSFRRANRRQSAFGSIIRPGYVGYKPKIAVVIDTSGSMDEDALASAISVIDSVAKATGSPLEVITGDTEAHTVKKNVSRSAKITLEGGGGTDMAAIMEDIDRRPQRDRPDLLIVATDGYTDWPRQRTRMQCLAIIFRYVGYAPKWMRQIDLSNADWS